RLGVDGMYQQFFSGAVDDLRIYSRALTLSEIQSVMQTPVLGGPGSVPDGGDVPGLPLRMGKGALGTLDLTWSPSCSAAATGYAIYQGTLPIAGTYNHVPLDCGLGSVTSANITPAAGNRYYLVAPETATSEGSY